MVSLVDVYNLAISSSGQTRLLSDPDDRSPEAVQCRLWAPFVLEGLISAAPWPSTRRYARLVRLPSAPVDPWSSGSPAPARQYAYAAPSDMVQPVNLQSYLPFEFLNGVISCDEENPILYYNAIPEDVSQWDVALRQAVVYSLAAAIAKPLTGKPDIAAQNFQLAAQRVDEMRAMAANFGEVKEESIPDWIAARGYVSAPALRYIYPFASISSEFLG